MQKRTQEEWITLIEECKKSKKSVSVFCREKNIPKTSFFYWAQKEKALPKDVSLKRANFIELKDQKVEDAIEIRYEKLLIRLEKGTYAWKWGDTPFLDRREVPEYLFPSHQDLHWVERHFLQA